MANALGNGQAACLLSCTAQNAASVCRSGFQCTAPGTSPNTLDCVP